MHIKELEVRNFRGLDVEIKSVEKISMIIGKNDSGKTNLCQAILKVLDYKKRKNPFLISDSTNSNGKEIKIRIVLDAENLNDEQLGTVGNLIYKNIDDKKEITAQLTSIYNDEIGEYEDQLIYGDPKGDFIQQRNSVQTSLDKILSIIYISPTYDIHDSESNYFSFVEKTNKENGILFSDEIAECLEVLKDIIQSDSIITSIQNDINSNDGFNELFEQYKFKVVPKIKQDNLYKSLDVVPYKEKADILYIGDAKNKLLSTIFKSKIYDENKEKIYLVEEPENHLYVLLQRMYIKALMSLNPEQIIFTTHSPFTIDFEKVKQIIKITDCNKINSFNNKSTDDFRKYGYLINVQIAEMIYYDVVLLVEGASEKYFYSYLMSNDDSFLKAINDRRIGICEIDGIAFKNTKELLEKLGIKVYIKTDNDIYLNPKKTERRYAGILRCISYLAEDDKIKFYESIGVEENDFSFSPSDEMKDKIECKMDDICSFFYSKGIFLSKHHNGFEGDFLEFLSLNDNVFDYNELLDYLKMAKLKNLHSFISEEKFKLKITDKSKNSILVRFLYE
ncbi:MAG: AAA family ATPase [Clostridia bacterium]|nr:AAA family ATPase [Clostridia bacterium]